jgi:hypothetical protein
MKSAAKSLPSNILEALISAGLTGFLPTGIQHEQASRKREDKRRGKAKCNECYTPLGPSFLSGVLVGVRL